MTTYVKVSELPASTVLADADVFIYNDDTTTSKITFSNLKTGIRSYVLGESNTFTGTTTFNGNVTFGSVTITGLLASDFGLGNVSNTSDANKPISTATQSALDFKAPLAGPIFTGVPVAPTAAAGTNTTQIATTEFVTSAITADNVTDALLASPALTGTPTAPTASAGTNTTQLATTEFVTAALTADNSTETLDEVATRGATTDVDLSVGDLFTVRGDGSSQDGRIKLNCSQNSHGVTIQAPPHSASATYTLTLPTTDGGAGEFLTSDGSGVLSWTGVASVLSSAALTGTPTAPTATAGTNTTQVATTAFVTAAITADNATDLILGTSSIDALGDVDTTTAAPSSGDFLKFDGSNFVPGLPDAPTTFELDGTTLRNITGGHTFALRNAALSDTITLNSETGAIDVTGATTFGGDVNFNSGALFFKQSNNRLGIGTTSPGGAIHVTHGSVNALFQRAGGSSKLAIKPNATDDGMTIQGQANSTNSIRFEGYGNNIGFRFEENDGGTIETLAHIKSTGIDFNKDVTFAPSASVTPADNGDLMVEATNDTTLTFKFKGSDGVVRSGTITLS